MASSKGPSSIRNTAYNGKNSLLPPKSPFPSIVQSYVDYVPSSINTPKGIPKPRDVSRHQRTSSESFLVEEQPSWLDDLLNEPETPVRRGHRRSNSDSFTYTDAINMECAAQDELNYRNMMSTTIWGSQEVDNYRDVSRISYYPDPNHFVKQKKWMRDSPLNKITHPSGLLSSRESVARQGLGSASATQDVSALSSTGNERQEPAESGPHDPKVSSERKDSSVKPNASETDTKRAKQQFAQRSRVRKLQYIAELERNVQALQEESSEVSAELEFLNQQVLILSMENKALKQRLESLAQEHLIKCFEHELLEREIGRLRALYQQQQLPQQQQPQKQQQSSTHRRKSSKDLDQQFANFSLKS